MVSPDGQRFRGWVRSFRGTWGFLNAEAFEGDLFVGLKGNPHLTSLSQDDQVEFDVKTDEKGKAEAVNVIVCSSSGAQPTQPPAQMQLQAQAQMQAFGQLQAQLPAQGQAPAATHGAHAPADLGDLSAQMPGVRYKGWVRSFTGSWGFVNSEAFNGDLFVGLRSNPHLSGLSQNEPVEFEIRCNGSGKNEAVNVTTPSQQSLMPAKAPGAGGNPHGPAERAQVGHLVGQQVTGRIKSFRDQWGFVNSDSFMGDLFIHARSNPELGPVMSGDAVLLEVAEDPTSSGGEYHAVNASVVKEDSHNLMGETLRGWVKSFKDQWGLLNSNRFEGDVFVGVRANPHLMMTGLQQGECVEFQIASDQKGGTGIQAIKVKQLGQTMRMPASAPAVAAVTVPRLGLGTAGFGLPKQAPEALVGHRAAGTVRSFREGWGFVISDDFEGDLFLHQGSNPGLPALSAGDSVTFDISLGTSGKCHATKVQVVSAELKDLVGRQLTGMVRSFQDTWGFITCPKFDGDLFVGLRSNAHLVAPLKSGEAVEFTVARSNTNKSQTGFEAINVTAAGSGASGMLGAAAFGMTMASQGMAAFMPAAGRGAAGDRSRSPRPMGLGGMAGMGMGMGGAAPGLASGGPRDPANMVGASLSGFIRSFRGSWGFAQSESFDGDLFIGTRSNPQLPREPTAGDRITFRISQSSGGKAEAVDVQLL